MSEHPPGAVCIIHQGRVCAEVARFFSAAILPPGSIFVDREGGNPAEQRNLCVADAFERLHTRLGWVVMLDSDQAPLPRTIMDLLESGGDIVSAAIHSRHYPMPLVGYTHLERPEDRRSGVNVTWDHLPAKCIAVGMGCTLIRRSVFESMTLPWFRAGEISPGLLTEDIGFCLRATAEAGAQPQMIRSKVGHRGEVIYWPADDGGIEISFPDRPASWKIPLDLP